MQKLCDYRSWRKTGDLTTRAPTSVGMVTNTRPCEVCVCAMGRIVGEEMRVWTVLVPVLM